MSLGSTTPPTRTPPRFDHQSANDTVRLEIEQLDETPFSHSFGSLLDGLGLNLPGAQESHHKGEDCSEVSYELENFTAVKDIDPEWSSDDVEEAILMTKRPSKLATIEEDPETTPDTTEITVLADFDFNVASSLPGTDPLTKICIRRDTGQKYMIKCRRGSTSSGWSEKAILEFLKSLPLSFLPCMHWSFQEKEYAYIVTDFHPTSLSDVIRKSRSLASHHVLFYASEIVSALSTLHESGIMHRNLNADNIRLDGAGHIVLVGFDCATCVTHSRSNEMEIKRGLLSGIEYKAPEVLLGWAHDSSVDCWAFGMLLYWMYFGSHPYGGQDVSEDVSLLRSRIVDSSIPAESLRLVHPMARDLILKCLERNPSVRWDIKRVKQHPYFVQVDWKEVTSKKLEVPYFMTMPTDNDSKTVLNIEKSSISMNVPISDGDFTPSCPDSAQSTLERRQTGPSTADSGRTSLSELLKPVIRMAIPSIVPGGDEPVSESGTIGHPILPPVSGRHSTDLTTEEKMSRLWNAVEQEERCSNASVNSMEFGEQPSRCNVRAFKLRKHRSSIQPQNRLFSLSTSSLHSKLWKKPPSTGALRTKPVEPIPNLPMGIHQIGSGIGFAYNLPSQAASKASVASFAPSACHGMFYNGLSVVNLGLGFRSPRRAAKAKAQVEATSQPLSEEVLGSREVGTGTFILDIYRAPSWILSPPDSVPSPMALVNEDSPFTDSDPSGSDPPTPTTLVDLMGEEVNIIIPKDLSGDFPEGVPGLTLRLVPSSAGLRMSYIGNDSEDSPLFTAV